MSPIVAPVQYREYENGLLPPVADKPLYHSKPSGVIGEQGHLAYLMFDKVVKLTENQRVQGSNPDQVSFKLLLERLRDGDSTREDWQQLLSRLPSAATNLSEFENAMRLFYSPLSHGGHIGYDVCILGIKSRRCVFKENWIVRIRRYVGKNFRLVIVVYDFKLCKLYLKSVCSGLQSNFID